MGPVNKLDKERNVEGEKRDKQKNQTNQTKMKAPERRGEWAGRGAKFYIALLRVSLKIRDRQLEQEAPLQSYV